jgi:hypothetical protein
MTAILSWFNREKDNLPYLMTVGDTKITGSDTILTLEGAKVLELPIKCKDISKIPHEIYFNSSIGFAFAGSSLVGLNVYCYLQTIFSNLGGTREQNNLPDYKSICLKAKEIISLYTSSIQGVSELMLSGFCPKSKIPFICIIKPVKIHGEIEYEIEMKDTFSSDVEIMLIGDKKQEIRGLVEAELSSQTTRGVLNYWRAPVKILNEIIEDKKFETIGGNLQLATISQTNYDTYAIVVPIKGQEPKATMKFRNFDIFEESGKPVGECIVAINGMVIK